MNIALSDRRVSPRHSFKLPLRIRIWKSAIPEQRTESENLSERERGIYPQTEWLCSGHVVRTEPFSSPRGKLGVGVQFDCL
jgi:hypothetical protein